MYAWADRSGFAPEPVEAGIVGGSVGRPVVAEDHLDSRSLCARQFVNRCRDGFGTFRNVFLAVEHRDHNGDGYIHMNLTEAHVTIPTGYRR
jgi:hypothetical protein